MSRESRLYEALGYNPQEEIQRKVQEALENGRDERDIRAWVEDAIYVFYNPQETP